MMSGSEGGVQNLLRKAISTKEREAFTPYVHCPTHQLNAVLAHAAEKNAYVRILFFRNGARRKVRCSHKLSFPFLMIL